MTARRAEFHSHTVLTDGELLGIELIRRAVALGHRAIAVTDHVSLGNIEWVVRQEILDCDLAKSWDILAIPGVEITHVPPDRLDDAVRAARRAGARVVVVHGETISEPVAPGTNRRAVSNPDVDILAHPGLITREDADLARSNDVFLEISTRRAHAPANGHVAREAEGAVATPIVDSDAHAPGDLVTQDEAVRFARAAGLPERLVTTATEGAPDALLKRLGLL
ncbi:MAG: histidinol phosphate phosphatase domain-containing protein [Methanobacteriota archaeon]